MQPAENQQNGKSAMGFPEIPGYQIQEEIGRGGMGVVYRARQIALDRTVALKVLHARFASDDDFIKSFAQEAKIVARLAHPNIVSVYDFGCHDGTYYLSMQFVHGKTVKDILTTRQLRLDECVAIVSQIADALDFAHRQEVIHRDVKPGNIMVTNDGKALIMDFGVAYGAYSTGANSIWLMAGSPTYMSPEQCKGRNASPRSDQYSLGVAVYEMATGRLPYPSSDPVEVMRQHVNDPPPSLIRGRTDIPPRFEAAVQRSMSKLPEMRFQSLADFAHELRAALQEAPRLDHLAHAAPVPTPSAAQSGVASRRPVSLIDGTPVAPAASPSGLPGGYVYTTRGGHGGEQRRQIWIWLGLILAMGALAAGLYAASLRSSGSPPTGGKPATGKSRAAKTSPASSPRAAAKASPVSRRGA